ncbi:MAG: putative branched-chain amino acid ABC transporter periplasmic component [Hyphomonadaceae bacterium]|nr:MAG: putative branched-chain amino acid ABC transporter periplasmic component [Hyphomonadaceae bacterium]
MALSESGDGKTVFFTEDSGATPEEATNAVKSALAKGADVVLGPLFASGVTAVAPYTRANNALLFSFSTDSTEAGRGVYVFSFLPEGDARRIVDYAGSHGIRRMVILAPIGRYGDRIVAAATASAVSANITILGTERYEVANNVLTGATDAARRAAVLSRGGARGQTAIYLGTSQWNEPTTISDSRALGSWFVRTDIATRANFETKLRNQSQRRATRLAGMGYDVMTMLARMGVQGDKSTINPTTIENPAGFQGVDGHYHFENGIIARDLAVVEIAPNGARIIEAAR